MTEFATSTPARGAVGRGLLMRVSPQLFDRFILVLIWANVAALILETVPEVAARWGGALAAFEGISVLIFTAEYVLRLRYCVRDPRYARPVLGRVRYALTPMALIDLLAFAPYYLPALGIDLRVLRVARSFRLFRVAKLGRYSIALQTLARVVITRRAELAASLAVMCLLLLVSGSVMYFVEHAAQPDDFRSIPATLWWAVSTITTVGYGDVVPVTSLGRVIASIIAVLGIGMFALPTGILGAAFLEEYQRAKGERVCRHCGQALD